MERSNLHIFPTASGVVALAPIDKLEELERNATEDDLQSVAAFTAPSRRTERLAWRALLRRVSPNSDFQVEYLPNGKPQIINSSYKHISVSHCRDVVAVALSQSPCGVDVERCDRDFDRLKMRYMNDDELSLLQDSLWPAVAWCAKEALYKYGGREGVDFKRDIIIISAEQRHMQWSLLARLFDEETVVLDARIDGEHILVFTL